MSDFSAFLMGMLLADSRPITTTPKKGKFNRNTALQDVIFCQSLRNMVDGLEEYVRKEHPSPLEFITHLLPDENFEEPYTTEEKQIIAENKRRTQTYVRNIEEYLTTNDKKWENLSAVKMIWQDETHTPDFDHLDLLFGNSLLSKPVKQNGRLYEYNTSVPLHGLAKGFFDTVPAQIIFSTCSNNTDSMLKSYGYLYDFTRFEYDRYADKLGRLNEWRKEQRTIEYLRLLETFPGFCKSAWSDFTHNIKSIEQNPKSEQIVDKEEKERRKEEVEKICCTLTTNEITSFLALETKRTSTCIMWISIIVSLVLLFIGGVLFEPGETDFDIFLTITFFVFALGMTAMLSYDKISSYFPRSKEKEKEKVHDHVITLQESYYNKKYNENAIKYAELLKRIKK